MLYHVSRDAVEACEYRLYQIKTSCRSRMGPSGYQCYKCYKCYSPSYACSTNKKSMDSNMFFTAFPKMKVKARRVAENVEKPCG